MEKRKAFIGYEAGVKQAISFSIHIHNLTQGGRILSVAPYPSVLRMLVSYL